MFPYYQLFNLIYNSVIKFRYMIFNSTITLKPIFLNFYPMCEKLFLMHYSNLDTFIFTEHRHHSSYHHDSTFYSLSCFHTLDSKTRNNANLLL